MEKYVLVHNGQVILGPFFWSKMKFQDAIQEDFELTVQLPDKMTPDQPYTVDAGQNIKIYSVRNGVDIPHNPRIEIHHGPFWEFFDTHAEYHYRPHRMELPVAKSQALRELAAERYNKEVAGTKITLQNLEISIDTSREGRTNYIHKYSAMDTGDVISWKFPEGWLTLAKDEIGQIVDAINTHVQQAFDWEKGLADQINGSGTHEILSSIVVVQPKTADSVPQKRMLGRG